MRAIRPIHTRMPAGRNSWATRRGRASIVLAFGLAAAALSLGAEPAGAVVANVAGHAYGLTPMAGVNPAGVPAVQQAVRAPGASTTGPLPYDKFGQLSYHGGPVMHSVTTHVIYWDPTGEFTLKTKGIVNQFFTDVAHDSGLARNVFGVGGQYGDGTGHALYSSTFASEGVDGTAYPTTGNCTIPAGDPGPYTTCLTDAQLRSELGAYVAKEHLQKGSTQQYFMLLPHKIVTCLEPGVCSNNVICAYHSAINPSEPSNEIIYSDIPFSVLDKGHVKECQFDGNAEVQNPNGDTAGTEEATRYADVALKYTSHEYIEAATDPQGNAWWEPAHGQEIGDKCNFAGSGSGLGEDPNAFLPTLGGSAPSGTLFNQIINEGINEGHFYLQSEWDNAAEACNMKPVPISGGAYTVEPASGLVGAPIAFKGAATDIYARLRFTWKWGDGTESAGVAPTHVYTAPGSYEVTMTPKDELTFATSSPVIHTIVVNDQPTTTFTIIPNPATERIPVSFNGFGSADADGSIASYSWNFGDDSPGPAPAPSHTYLAPGNYTVTLTVTDSAGVTSAISHNVGVLAASSEAATAHSTSTTASTPSAPILAAAVPNSAFVPGEATFDQATGSLTFTESVGDPGTFRWLLTFPNGRFGVFAASNHKCKAGFVRLGGKCRPSKIVFAKGSQAVAEPGAVTVKLKPSASALKALKNALKKKKGLPVTITLTFQSARGGSPVSHTQVMTFKLKRK
jgi:PKD repeat protein